MIYRWRPMLRLFDWVWRVIPDGWFAGKMKYRYSKNLRWANVPKGRVVPEAELKATIRRIWHESGAWTDFTKRGDVVDVAYTDPSGKFPEPTEEDT